MAISTAQLRTAVPYYGKVVDLVTRLETLLAAEDRPSEQCGLNRRLRKLRKHELNLRIRISLSLVGVDGETFREAAGILDTYPKARWRGLIYEGFYTPAEQALAEAELANLSAV